MKDLKPTSKVFEAELQSIFREGTDPTVGISNMRVFIGVVKDGKEYTFQLVDLRAAD